MCRVKPKAMGSTGIGVHVELNGSLISIKLVGKGFIKCTHLL
jgi:hypothetical protein